MSLFLPTHLENRLAWPLLEVRDRRVDSELHARVQLFVQAGAVDGLRDVIVREGHRDLHASLEGVKKEEKKSSVDRRAIYSINAEGINIAFLGNFSENTLTESQEEALGEADILIIPVGGKGGLDASSATELSNQLEPFIIIPSHYKTSGLKIKLDSVDEFLKEFGDKGEDMEKLLIKKSDFEEEKTKVVSLSPQR